MWTEKVKDLRYCFFSAVIKRELETRQKFALGCQYAFGHLNK
jgi:hypothetical protein